MNAPAWPVRSCRSPRRRRSADPSAAAACMSSLTAAMPVRWSGVSVYGKRGVEFLLPFGIGRKPMPGGWPAALAVRACRWPGRRPPLRRPLSAGPRPCRRSWPASAGLAAADVFLHQFDLRCRHVDLRAAVEFQFEMLFGVAFFFQQTQAAIAADAVGMWTTRSPSRSSRKLSMTRPKRRRDGRLTSARWNSSLPPSSMIRSAPGEIRSAAGRR